LKKTTNSPQTHRHSAVYAIYLFLWKSSLKLLKIHKVI